MSKSRFTPTNMAEAEAFNQSNVYNKLSPLGYGRAHFARRRIFKNEIVVFGFGKLLDHQTDHCSIQFGFNTHILPKKNTGKYWNHSCDPTCKVRTANNGFPCLVAIRDIEADEEITFSYFMTEFEFGKTTDEHKIECGCGKDNCKGKIFSFSMLSKEEQLYYRENNMISAYLEEWTDKQYSKPLKPIVRSNTRQFAFLTVR